MTLQQIYDLYIGVADQIIDWYNSMTIAVAGVSIATVFITFVILLGAYRYFLQPALASDKARKRDKDE